MSDRAKRAEPKVDPDRADEAPAKAPTAKQLSAARVKGARFFAGQWIADDGTPLTDAEAQQAHRAMDEAAAEKARQGGA